MTTMAPSRPSIPPHDHTPRPYSGPSRQEVLAMRRQYCHPSTFLYYREPLMVVEGHMQYLYDETGRRYLDFIRRYRHGLMRPFTSQVPRAICRSSSDADPAHHHDLPASELPVDGSPSGSEDAAWTRGHLLRQQRERGQRSRDPDGEDVHREQRCDRGSERLSRWLAELDGAHLPCHMEVSGPARITASITRSSPDPYRSPFRGTPEEIASRSAADIRDLDALLYARSIAAFIAEPIQGVGGDTHRRAELPSEAYAIIREYGGLCIADEVQTGFGRTGDQFWGFENFGRRPGYRHDGQGNRQRRPARGGDHRREIARSNRTNASISIRSAAIRVSMAAGLAVLDVIDEDGMQENARVIGGRLKKPDCRS